MKKIFFLSALLCASLISFGQEMDVNYALSSNGASATASSGDAGLAIDDNNGTRWESDATDDEWWRLDMGQERTFNTIRINWETAYAKEFTITYSSDGEKWSEFYVESGLESSGWQTIYSETPVTARYINYHGTLRATGWGQSFFEFQVMMAEAPRENIALHKPIVASSTGYNDVNRVVDGNYSTEWQGSETNGTEDDEESRTFDAWFVVDLEQVYTVDQVNITFEGACSQDYRIDFSEDNQTWAVAYEFAGNAGIYGRTDAIKEPANNQKVRFVRFWSTKAATQWGVKIFEIEVFGELYIPSDDNEKPVMISAELVSTTSNSAVIAVEASDDNAVAKFRVVDTEKGIDAEYAPTDGKITVTDLTPETAYNFVISAIDSAQKESDNSLQVSVTTEKEVNDGICPVEAEMKSNKELRNGVLYIRRNGRLYNISGAAIE